MCSIAAKKQLLRREDGAALVVTLMMLLGLASLALMISVMSSTDLSVSGNDRQYQAALDVAEAGVAEAMHRLALRPGTNVTVGGSTIDASIRDMADPPDPDWRARIFLTPPSSAPAGSTQTEFTTGTLQAAGQYLRYSDPNDPADALVIQHRLADFNGDGINEVVLYDPSRIPSENPVTGAPIERITVIGRQGSARRQIQVDVIRFPINANVVAALSTDGRVDLRGNVTVCGRDHRIDTPNYTKLPACSPAWDTADGHLTAVQTTGDLVQTAGTTDLLGNPSPTDTDPANQFMDIAQSLGVSADDLRTILEGADHTSLDADPLEGVTYIDGDISINGLNGEGLLYVTGDLQLTGNVVWRGLIFVEGRMMNGGTTWILGGLIVRGDTISVDFGAGTPTVLYSRAMLTQALITSMRYVVLNWKEI